ncbi:MAG: CinA family protein [Pseudomonadota bacterium]
MLETFPSTKHFGSAQGKLRASDGDLHAAALRVGRVLSACGRKLATAESCTGGWIAQCVTSIPGSSAWFERGFVTYSNESKEELLGVPAEVIATHGAVSAETVAAMAGGALARSRADCAVAVSGIAGPAGGSPDKPVGTVWLAWQLKGAAPITRRFRFEGGREAVRREAVMAALEGLIDVCAGAA